MLPTLYITIILPNGQTILSLSSKNFSNSSQQIEEGTQIHKDDARPYKEERVEGERKRSWYSICQNRLLSQQKHLRPALKGIIGSGHPDLCREGVPDLYPPPLNALPGVGCPNIRNL